MSQYFHIVNNPRTKLWIFLVMHTKSECLFQDILREIGNRHISSNNWNGGETQRWGWKSACWKNKDWQKQLRRSRGCCSGGGESYPEGISSSSSRSSSSRGFQWNRNSGVHTLQWRHPNHPSCLLRWEHHLPFHSPTVIVLLPQWFLPWFHETLCKSTCLSRL